MSLVVVAGCPKTPAARPGADAAGATSHAAVALIVDGRPFESAAARDGLAALFQQRTGRPVRLFTTEPAATEVLPPIAKAAMRKGEAYDWNEPACRRRSRPLLPAIAASADVVFRVHLETKTTTRPATEADRVALGDRVGRTLAAIGIHRNDHVLETRITGTIERTSFPGLVATHRQTVRWAGRRIATDEEASPEDLRAAVGTALTLLPAPPSPKVEALARDLVSKGCPFLAYALGDTLAGDARRRVENTALAAMRRPPAAAERKAAIPAVADVSAPVAPAKPTPERSCSALCSLHMVELCNGNRTLWSRHGSHWESTRCGERRPEPFLAECYRTQWSSGTYERACVRPCEETPEGHQRLQAMLQRSGCLRTASGG